nr:type I iodothyronine deiodinase-like [Lytechinus pictus]
MPFLVIRNLSFSSKACVVGGTLADIVRDYRGQVDFLAVYLAEAHAEGTWPLGSNTSYMKEHKSLQERMSAARDLLKIDTKAHGCMTDDVADVSKFRIVVDQMDNLFSRMFKAFPDRVIFIREGKIVYFGKNILGQMQDPSRLMTHEAREWLEENVGPALTQ